MSFNSADEFRNENEEKFTDIRSHASNVWNNHELNTGSGESSSDNYSVSYVSDGDMFTNDEDFQEDNDSPRTPTRLLSELRERVDSLQRKNEAMERDYFFLQAQMSSLEDLSAKKGKELNAALQKLSVSNQLVNVLKQRHEEAEERMSLLIEENEHIAMKLSHFEKQNVKLNETVKNLENQIDTLANTNELENKKSQDMYIKLQTMSDSLSKSEMELEILKMKEKGDQEAIERVLAKNLHLQQQNASNLVIIQDLKSELKIGLKKLVELQNEKVANKIQPEECSDDLSDDDTKTIFDEFTIDSTIPLENSLFAELEDELIPNSKCCNCMWEKSWSVHSTKSNNTDSFETSDIAVNTEFNFEMSSIGEESLKGDTRSGKEDPGIDDSIKASSLRRKIISKIACFKTPKRPNQRH